MGRKTTITIHPKFKIGDISPLLYGAFLEPIGFMVNGNMYNPKHTSANEKGFRGDIEASNSYENPDNVLPSISSMSKYKNGKVKTTVKKLSWHNIIFKSLNIVLNKTILCNFLQPSPMQLYSLLVCRVMYRRRLKV